jgi:excisionase family DNA binding protein
VSEEAAKNRPGGRREETLSIRGAAERLGVSRATVRNWIDKGLLRATGIPSARRVSAPDVERVISEMGGRDFASEGDRIADFLRTQPREVNRILITLHDLNETLALDLPPQARHKSWWMSRVAPRLRRMRPERWEVESTFSHGEQTFVAFVRRTPP